MRRRQQHSLDRLQFTGEPELAVEYARRAHELSRRNVDYLNTLGVAYAETGVLELAKKSFIKVLKLKPGCVDALVNLAKVLDKRDELPAALRAYERAYALSPSFPKLLVTLAKTYRQLGMAERAEAFLEEKPIDEQDWILARAECDFERRGESAAIERLRAAVAGHPDWPLARGALAHLLLATAHWREGWQLYRFPPPETISGKHVLLRGEQGIGDVLFFLRFAPALRERGATITLACEKKLHSILSPGPVLDEICEDTGQGLRLGDLPLLLRSEDTPPAWPLEHREKANLESFGPGPYLGVTWRAGTDVARRRELGQDPSALMKALDFHPSRPTQIRCGGSSPSSTIRCHIFSIRS